MIDMVVTDHSPCPPAMKGLQEGNFQNRIGRHCEPLGGTSNDVDEARRRGFALTDIARWMSESRRGSRGAMRARGESLPVVTRTSSFLTLTRSSGYTRNGCIIATQYRRTWAKPPRLGKRTYLRGRVVFQDGKFLARLAGGNSALDR